MTFEDLYFEEETIEKVHKKAFFSELGKWELNKAHDTQILCIHAKMLCLYVCDQDCINKCLQLVESVDQLSQVQVDFRHILY